MGSAIQYNVEQDVGPLLAFGGLAGTFVVALLVEKSHTKFWTGFGNILALLSCGGGLVITDLTNPRVWLPALVVGLGVLFLFFVIFFVIYFGRKSRSVYEFGGESTRLFGQGWLVTSFASAMIVYFYTGGEWAAIIVFAGVVALVLYLKSKLRKSGF